MGARPLSWFSRLSLPSVPSWHRLRRRIAVAALLVVVLVAAYFLWLRDSSLVGVSEVEVVGADSDAGVQAALTTAAEDMTTLNLDVAALQAAVAEDPGVAAVSASADFPHGVTIEVELRRPAGWVDDGAGAVLAGDGVVLATGIERPEDLPVIDTEPAALGERADGPTLAIAGIMGGAPEELVPQIESGRIDSARGPVVELAGGVELRFGDATRPEPKWTAATAVLADPGFTGAGYIDLSVPSRPVAG